MKEFEELLKIITALLDPKNGCPWDIKQTPETLRPHMIEEVYEISEAIELNDAELLKEELWGKSEI